RSSTSRSISREARNSSSSTASGSRWSWSTVWSDSSSGSIRTPSAPLFVPESPLQRPSRVSLAHLRTIHKGATIRACPLPAGQNREGARHPRGHGGAPPHLPAGARGVGGTGRVHDLLADPRRRGRRELRQAAKGPLAPWVLRHPRGGVRRRLPDPPDPARARPD